MTPKEVIKEISKWANASHAYLCNREGYPRGYKDGISQAKTIVLEYLSKVDVEQDQSKQKMNETNNMTGKKELTVHQRGVILRGICNGAALRNKNPQIIEENTAITCDSQLNVWDICGISCDAEAFGMKVEFHYDGQTRIVVSSSVNTKEGDNK